MLNALPSSDDNVVCPVKLLLVQALRLDYTLPMTITDILTAARRRADQKVLWKADALNRPVTPAIAPAGSQLRLNDPAQPSQLSEPVKLAANVLGILVPVTAHDVRRGSARDVAHLGKIPGTSTKAAAAALGHS